MERRCPVRASNSIILVQRAVHHRHNRLKAEHLDRALNAILGEEINQRVGNVIPAITLESYELVTDQTKIRSSIDKRHAKDPRILDRVELRLEVQGRVFHKGGVVYHLV